MIWNNLWDYFYLQKITDRKPCDCLTWKIKFSIRNTDKYRHKKIIWIEIVHNSLSTKFELIFNKKNDKKPFY